MWQDVGKKIECCSDVITHGEGALLRHPGMARVWDPHRCHLSDKLKQETGMYILSCESSHYAEIREALIGERKKVHENEARVSEVRRMWADMT